MLATTLHCLNMTLNGNKDSSVVCIVLYVLCCVVCIVCTINDRRCEWNTNCALGSTANIPWIGQRLSVFLKAKNKDRVNIRKLPSKIRRLNTKAGTTKSSQMYSFLIPKKKKEKRAAITALRKWRMITRLFGAMSSALKRRPQLARCGVLRLAS